MRSLFRPALLTASLGLLATGCGADSSTDGPDAARSTYVPTVEAVDDPEPRLAVTYDGGVLVLRAADGEVLADVAMDGYLRLSDAGDDRHVMVSSPGAFTALDLGAWTVSHGDHGHSYVDGPELTGFSVAAEEPGHVVAHEGTTALFDDATGEITAFATHQLASLDDEQPELTTSETDEPHHGVAVVHEDGTTVRTVGNVEERSGVEVVDPAGSVVATSEECPGVHGEAFAGEVAVFGCEDGALVVDGTTLTKIQAKIQAEIRARGDYARSGNLAGHEESAYVLGDLKTDPDAELERPTRVSVFDTGAGTQRLVELGTSYTFRSLGRTPEGDGLVLGTDGALHVVDVERGEVTGTVPVVAAWEEPLEWQDPRPALEVVDGTAYVTEPATSQVHVVDLATLTVSASHDLPQVPDELVGVTG